MNVILIGGSSGVGKTTIAHIIKDMYGHDNVLALSGDDLHHWERHNPYWDVFTHFHPDANNLERGYNDLRDLIEGKSISRKHYNHDTGEFDSPVIIEPKPIIVYEGLHTLFDEKIRSLGNVKIFVDTEEDLKTEWKMQRDIKKRGYTYSEVTEMIRRRKIDEDWYILPQREYADVNMAFVWDASRKVQLKYKVKDHVGDTIASEIKKFYDFHRNQVIKEGIEDSL